jgi:hypothetical protein
MPDAWEVAHGLNPSDASDGNLCTLSALNAGYTNLEFFLNGSDGELSAPIPEGRPVPEVKTGLKLVKDEGTVEEALRNYIDHVNFMKNIKI